MTTEELPSTDPAVPAKQGKKPPPSELGMHGWASTPAPVFSDEELPAIIEDNLDERQKPPRSGWLMILAMIFVVLVGIMAAVMMVMGVRWWLIG